MSLFGSAEPAQGQSGGPPSPPVPTVSAASQGAALAVEVVAAEAITPGQPLAYEIVVRNPGSAAATAVRVEQGLPTGSRVVLSEPKAETQADRLAWSLGTVEAGSERRLKAEVRLGEIAELPPPTVSFAPAVAHRTRVVRPMFDVTVAGPEQAHTGEKVKYQIRIANNGTESVQHVLVRDQLPEGLQHPVGSFVEAEIGTLQAGETKTIPLEVTVVKPGSWVNEVSAQADGDLKAQARTTVAVVEPTLGLRLLGPRQATPGDIDLNLEVTNPATMPATGVRLSQAVPNGLDVVGATGNGFFDQDNRIVTWSLGTLEAGQKLTITLRLRTRSRGDWTLAAQVIGDRLGEAKATLEMRVEVTTALQLELAAHETTLATDAEATYEVHVANSGKTPAENLRLGVRLPEGLALVRADGPSALRQSPQGITFDPLPQLAARADAVYRIRLRGQRPGDWRLQLELSAEGASGPLREEVNVRVTGGQGTPRGSVAVSR
jgi:uncharacterized repeat protein (TIGR01451 family)